MLKYSSLVSSILISLLLLTQAKAQFAKDAHYWLSGGFGKTEFYSAMLAVGLEPAHRSDVIIARYTISGEVFPGVEPSIKVNELGLLYGIRLWKLRFSTGLSTLWGNNRGSYLYTDPDPLMGSGATYQYLGYTTVGIPGEIRFITSAKNVGIGITGYGNWNQKRPFLGLNVSFYVGRMRYTGLPSD